MFFAIQKTFLSLLEFDVNKLDFYGPILCLHIYLIFILRFQINLTFVSLFFLNGKYFSNIFFFQLVIFQSILQNAFFEQK